MKIKFYTSFSAFTLIELIVVTTIIIILASSSTLYFANFVGSQQVKQELSIIEDDLKDLDKSIKNYAIFDYEILFNTGNGNLAYILNTNIFDIQNPQVIDFNSQSGTGFLSILGGSSSAWGFKIYKNKKLFLSQVSSGNNTYTGSFLDTQTYTIIGNLGGKPINNLGISYFSESNLDKTIGNFLELTFINTLENKTGASYTNLKITNIGGKKEIWGDGILISQAYLFFEKGGHEEYILIK